MIHVSSSPAPSAPSWLVWHNKSEWKWWAGCSQGLLLGSTIAKQGTQEPKPEPWWITAALHCNIGSCNLKPIAWPALPFPNEGWRKVENSGWVHYGCIFKFPGEVWKLELALGPLLFLFFPSLLSFLLVWLTLVTGLHNFIRLGLMNHSSPASNSERLQARQGLYCSNQKQQKNHPHQETGNGGREKRRQWANSTHGQLSDVWAQTTSSTFICKLARPPRRPKRLLLFIKLDVVILPVCKTSSLYL